MSALSEELSPILHNGERVLGCVPAGFVHAGNHNFLPTNPHVLVTDQRIAFLSRKGMMKKRMEENVSWPLTSFTQRINTSEGPVQGSYYHSCTLFTQDEEIVFVGFRTPGDRDSYKGVVVEALAPVLGE